MTSMPCATGMERERSLAELAMVDTLTGLSNVRHFTEAVTSAVGNGADLSLFLLDLDRFKAVNDTLGHPTGDQLLRKVSERLRSAVRPGDLVARLGGDEFAILLQPAAEITNRERIAFRIIDLLSRPFLIDGNQVNIGTSIGITVAEQGTAYDRLIRQADLALYAAKKAGGGAHRHFQQAFAEEADARRALELELRKALTLRQFQVHYCPRLDVDTGRVVGLHAELRWQHPQRGLLLASSFVPLALQIGIAAKIERWLLEAACREIANLPQPLPLSVSLTEAHFATDGALVESVKHALLASGLQPSRLEIQVTEALLLTQHDPAIQQLHALRSLGIRVVMNDFGSGYASLTRLTSFPFDAIKIASIIAEPSNPANRAMVQAVAALGVSLGVATSIDGIGSPEQLAQLRRDGSVALQGCQLRPALAAAALQDLLREPNSIQLHP